LRKSTLKGFEIPGHPDLDRLIAMLFADDTTVYLDTEDSFERLQALLKTWCGASGAKFNIKKTEVIPVGTKAYRMAVLRTRQIDPTDPAAFQIPEEIRIVKEGETARILGGFTGNETNETAPWTPILEDIDRRLDLWERSHPTLDGRRLIIQMVIGGKTQYLTKVQGMPKHIEKKVEKRIRTFLWAGKAAPVNFTKMKTSRDDGGKDILDIVARNEAITITWLQSLLNMGEDRATWTYFADAILAHHAPDCPQESEEFTRMNMYLQSWKARTRALPKDLKEMVSIGAKYGLRLEGLAFRRDTMQEMPIWLH
ncbi:hypothetical protein BDZ89DRAFT_897313, partial [Hymenopellis radicata]